MGALKLNDKPSTRFGLKICIVSCIISSYEPGLGSSERSKPRHHGFVDDSPAPVDLDVPVAADSAAEKDEDGAGVDEGDGGVGEDDGAAEDKASAAADEGDVAASAREYVNPMFAKYGNEAKKDDRAAEISMRSVNDGQAQTDSAADGDHKAVLKECHAWIDKGNMDDEHAAQEWIRRLHSKDMPGFNRFGWRRCPEGCNLKLFGSRVFGKLAHDEDMGRVQQDRSSVGCTVKNVRSNSNCGLSLFRK